MIHVCSISYKADRSTLFNNIAASHMVWLVVAMLIALS